MSRFDEEPDGDPHGECALEIQRLQAELEEWRFTNRVDELDRHVTRLAEQVRVLRAALYGVTMDKSYGCLKEEKTRMPIEDALQATQ